MRGEASNKHAAPVGHEIDPFEHGELELVHATTQAQRDIWMSIALGGKNASRAYDESIRLHMRGPLDTGALKRAWRTVVRRHQALRASFTSDGSTMCIADSMKARMQVKDGENLSPEQRRELLDNTAQKHSLQTFDLAFGPLWRLTLVRLGPEEHWLFVTAHHLVCDGWSMAILLRELGELYSLEATGKGERLPPAARFSDFAARMGSLDAEERAKAETFWRARYEGGAPTLDLPLDRPRPLVRTHKAKRAELEVDAELLDGLKRLGASRKASLVATLSATLVVLLRRLTGHPSVVLGAPVAGQPVVGEDRLVGHCVSLLPLHFAVSLDETFEALLARVRTELLDAAEQAPLTVSELVKTLEVPFNPARVPLIPVTFNLDVGMDRFHFEGLDVAYFSTSKASIDFDINFNAVQLGKRFVIECEYNVDLFDETTILHRLREWETLMRAVIADPAGEIGSLRLLDDAARREMLEDWNATTQEHRICALHELVEAAVDSFADRDAIVFGEERLSYRELDQRANRLAHYLHGVGVEHGSRVALFLERSPRLIVSALAVSKAGGTYVPIDPAYPRERVRFVLEDAKCAVLLVDAPEQASLASEGIDVLAFDAIEPTLAACSSARLAATNGPDDVAYVIYTSGSTGRPKGVLTPHRAVANYVQSMHREPGVTADDVVLAAASIGFDMSVFDMWVPLTCGAKVVLATRDETASGTELVRMVDDCGVTITMLTPTSWRMMVAAGWAGSERLRALSGGEELDARLASELQPRVVALYNVYGPTETTVLSHMHTVTDVTTPNVIGRPLDNVRSYVLDERLELAPIGVKGELCIGGAGVALGYNAAPELTEQRFVADPLAAEPGAKLYRSGDVARWRSDGTIEWFGRIDRQVKVRGHRIELGEIEGRLCELPGIEAAVVEAREIAQSRELVGWVVARADHPFDEAVVRASLRAVLPPFMLPTRIVALDAFPTTSNGKVDRARLETPELHAHGTTSERPLTDSQRPETPIEEVLMELWEEELGVRPLRHQNFFDAGGDSMHAMRVIEAATLRGLHVRPTHFFRYPTIAQLAQHVSLRATDDEHAGSLVTLREGGSRPPIYFLHSVPGDLLHYGPLVARLGADQPCYGFQALGLGDENLEGWSIEKLASHYVDELLQFQPEGPYRLAGWCFGGNVATEMALELERRGKTVDFLGVIEAWPARAPVARVAHKVGQLLKMRTRAIPLIAKKGRAFVERKEKVDPREVFALEMNDGPFRRRREVYDRNIAALERYRSTFYPGDVWLFQAREAGENAIEDPGYGWESACKRLHRIEVEGEHELMLKPPSVDALAAAFRRAVP